MAVIWSCKMFRADAEGVYNDLQNIESKTPQNVVDYAAEHPESELYKCFTWDDTKAANEWRKQEARQVMRGRTGGWYNGLKDKRTTPQAARLLAKALQLDYEDILKSHSPKEEQIEAEIACEALRDDLSDENGVIDKSYYNAPKNALEAITEALVAIDRKLTRIILLVDALERENAETKLP